MSCTSTWCPLSASNSATCRATLEQYASWSHPKNLIRPILPLPWMTRGPEKRTLKPFNFSHRSPAVPGLARPRSRVSSSRKRCVAYLGPFHPVTRLGERLANQQGPRARRGTSDAWLASEPETTFIGGRHGRTDCQATTER